MKKELTEKERLFCEYYLRMRNSKEAASNAGYRFAEKSGIKLLKRKEILSYIKKHDKKESVSEKDIIAGLQRLAFGCVNDAVKLIFNDEPIDSKFDELNLFNVSEIKRQKGGAIEIKFFDRLKAMEKLCKISESSFSSEENSLYRAIEKSASAIGEYENE